MASGNSSNILILHRDSKRVAVALPPTLELALSVASQHFPSLLRPLHLTRNLPDFGGDVEITDSVWQTGWIQGHPCLTLDVHESDLHIQEEDVEPTKRIKLEESEQEVVEESSSIASNRLTKERMRASPSPVHQLKSPTTPSNPDLPQSSQRTLPSPPASMGEHSLSPPVEPALIPSMVPPETVYVRLVFRSPELPDMSISIKRSRNMIKILSRVADYYGIDREKCELGLRLLYDGIRLGPQTAGDLVDSDDLGTSSSPLVVDVFAELVGGPLVKEDYDRFCKKGEPLPKYRDNLLRILKPLPTDPYLPEPALSQ
ncbi:hypothetical protein JCM3765_006922 [Sporobolomyces pararoseus]